MNSPALKLRPDRNLAMELVRATEAAAIRAFPFVGRGEKEAADGAAVDAMRAFLATVEFSGRVVIGEGEKDAAPMLFNGELVGNGEGPECDVAVDPIDGTSLTAAGRQHALSVIAVADRGTMLDASASYYMNKLVTGPTGKVACDIRQSVADNVKEFARAAKKNVGEVVVAVLDRPRHQELIEQIRSAGATTRLMLDGDVAGGIQAARADSRIDICMGVGGSPEGVVTACAIRALGGFLQGQIVANNEVEAERAIASGLDLTRIYELNDLVASENTFFVATGVTDGALLKGVRRAGTTLHTESIVIRGNSGTVRFVTAEHRAERWS